MKSYQHAYPSRHPVITALSSPPSNLPEIIIAGGVGIFAKTLTYNILGFTLLASLIGLFFGGINIFGEAAFQVLESFSAIFLQGKTEINEDDLISVYPFLLVGIVLLSLVLDLFLWIFKKLIEKIFHLEREETVEKMMDIFIRRLKRNSVLIAIIYVIAIATIPFAQYTDGTNAILMALALVGFCIIAMISNTIYVAIDTVSNRILWHTGAALHRNFL